MAADDTEQFAFSDFHVVCSIFTLTTVVVLLLFLLSFLVEIVEVDVAGVTAVKLWLWFSEYHVCQTMILSCPFNKSWIVLSIAWAVSVLSCS